MPAPISAATAVTLAGRIFIAGGQVAKGPIVGAVIAVVIITATRGRPNKDECEAAEGGALPILDSASGNTH